MRTMTHLPARGAIPSIELRHRLRLAREYAGLEQIQLHQRTGISRATISGAERGRTRPHPSTIMAWAGATGVDYEWLTHGTGTRWSGPAGDDALGPAVRLVFSGAA